MPRLHIQRRCQLRGGLRGELPVAPLSPWKMCCCSSPSALPSTCEAQFLLFPSIAVQTARAFVVFSSLRTCSDCTVQPHNPLSSTQHVSFKQLISPSHTHHLHHGSLLVCCSPECAVGEGRLFWPGSKVSIPCFLRTWFNSLLVSASTLLDQIF